MTIKYIGGDVAKEKIDFAIPSKTDYKKYEVKNNITHLEKFAKKNFDSESSQIIMEATGIYHHKLVLVLDKLGIKFSVINPVRTANHNKTLMNRAKTDAIDSASLADYGQRYTPKPSKMNSELMSWSQSMLKAVDALNKELSALKNRYEASSNSPFAANEVLVAYRESIKAIEKQIENLEGKIKKRLLKEKPNEVKSVKKISGVGDKGAALIIAFFGKFENFETSKQVVGFIGADPSAHDSGKFNGKRSISKKGNRYIRKILYMMSLSAGLHNKECIKLRERLEAKGKAHRQIRVAVGNKLLRQIFAVVKYDREWNQNYMESVNLA